MAQEQSAQALFDEAIVLLNKNAWKDAIDKLLEVRARGLVSADLENNLGRAFCEGGQSGPCIEHLTNAIALDRWNQNYRNDLAVAQSKIESGLGQPFNHPAENAHQFASYIRPIEFLSLSSFTLIIILALYFLKKLTRKYLYLLGSLSLSLLALSIFSLMSAKIAIVKIDADLKFGPLESADTVQVLKSGTRLRFIRESGPYVEVERTNSFRGWLKSEAITKSPF